MKCPKCGWQMRAQVNLFLDIPGSLIHRLSKAALRRRSVLVKGAGWDKALYYCRCGHYVRHG